MVFQIGQDSSLWPFSMVLVVASFRTQLFKTKPQFLGNFQFFSKTSTKKVQFLMLLEAPNLFLAGCMAAAMLVKCNIIVSTFTSILSLLVSNQWSLTSDNELE